MREATDDKRVDAHCASALHAIRIIAAPLGATVQDAGRIGWLHAGVPPSGPLDATAHAAANLAVGNDPRDAALEIPLGELRIAAVQPVRISIDGETAVSLAAGQDFVVSACPRAVRYLAVAGGVAVAPVLGSRATLMVAGWGGFAGRFVRAGDVLPVGSPPELSRHPNAVPSITDPPDPATLRVRPGPHVARMPAEAWEQLLATTWRVSTRGDRVGVRLEGPAIARSDDDRGPPVPMVRGAIQITTDGTPIVLGPDHPVTGGYPVLAVVGRASQAMLARLRPGRTLRFLLETS
jgi:biotin-dependent carboxylase-like uncharacterized protein